MAVTFGTIGTYIGSFFTADAAVTAGAGAAEAGAGAAAGGAAAAGGTAAATAGTAGLASVGVADVAVLPSVAGAVSASGGSLLGTIGTTVAEASAAAQGASSLYSMINPTKVNVPPPPGTSLPDQTALAADQAQKQREMAAGGIQGTTGTSGGQAGAVLNPSNTASKTLLGG